MNRFPELLKYELTKELPGTEVQWQMASADRMLRNYPRKAGPDARAAAVLIMLYPENHAVYTTFMQRPNYDGVHGGQISFPGGKMEPSDKDIIHTALREAQEETGIDISGLNILGTLTPLFIPVSNMLVTPVAVWIKKKPFFKIKPDEVVYLFNASLERLMDPTIIKEKPFEVRGEMINVKYYDFESHVIWGATAMMLHELLVIINNIGIISL
jgi:8-oxo-dGTP pyrophosphatase MutT (NUDIX family)